MQVNHSEVNVNMTERPNTLVCTFETASPRITAYDIHEWIYSTLRLPDSEVNMIQIDRIKRQVFIKMTNIEKVQAVINATGGEIDYTYPTRQISTVTIAVAGLGTKHIRAAILSPEVSHDELRAALTPYGKTVNTETEKWSNNYRYAVDNGVRQATVLMTKHVPSHLTVAGYRVLLSYEGQPATCYGCGAIGHLYHDCPIRQKLNQDRLTPTQQT